MNTLKNKYSMVIRITLHDKLYYVECKYKCTNIQENLVLTILTRSLQTKIFN